MKKLFILLAILNFGFALGVQAKISSDAFNSGETLTAGKLFLNQVDTVSLYLSTPKIVYVPKLSKELHLNMSLTLLGISFGGSPEEMQNYIQRHINTFNKTLMERLQFYTPQLAKEFDAGKDVDFVIRVGADKKTIATWSGGVWNWVEKMEPSESPSAAAQQPVEPKETAAPKKKCPAMMGGSKVTKAEAPQAQEPAPVEKKEEKPAEEKPQPENRSRQLNR